MSDGGTIFMEQMLANRRAQAIIDAVDDSRYWRDQYDKLCIRSRDRIFQDLLGATS